MGRGGSRPDRFQRLQRAAVPGKGDLLVVYVDDAMIPWRRGVWCHLQADTLEELHAFAAKLGLKREWFQPGSRPEAAHYDVTKTKRAEAIRLGAIEETTREGSARRRRVRAS